MPSYMKDIIKDIVVTMLIFLLIYNIFSQGANFFIISLAQIIEILVLGVFFYILNRKNSQLNKRKDMLVYVLDEILEYTNNDMLDEIKDINDIDILQVHNRKLVNRIENIRLYALDIVESKDIDYIYNEYIRYEDLLGEDIDNIDRFKANRKNYIICLSNIGNRVSEIKLKIY